MRLKTKQSGTLKADEIHQAEQILFGFVQIESFPNVSKSIANGKEISKTLNIAKLSPFIEEDGTIRARGRRKHSNLDYNAKHPILLTAKYPVVQIMLEKAHRDNLHGGKEYVRNMLQQEYFGLFEVKLRRRNLKRCCCLFSCLTTRAVHIEVTQSLDTESCLAAVTRIIARLGYPKTIISDNGTNFVGAAKELKAFMNEWDKDKIKSDLAQKKIFFLEIQSSRSSSLWGI